MKNLFIEELGEIVDGDGDKFLVIEGVLFGKGKIILVRVVMLWLKGGIMVWKGAIYSMKGKMPRGDNRSGWVIGSFSVPTKHLKTKKRASFSQETRNIYQSSVNHL